jgi:predicted RNA-binding Zn ribbon-like protein
MKAILPVIETHTFAPHDFVGGHRVLDFVNTVTGRDQTPRDWVPDYAAYLGWLKSSSAFPTLDLNALARRAGIDPVAAKRALKDTKRFREASFSIFSAFASHDAVDPEQVDIVERRWRRAANSRRLVAAATQLEFAYHSDVAGLDLPTHLIAVDAVALLEVLPSKRLRMCAGSNCSWLFIDHSKAGRRKWCDMATCGNVAKARRFYGSRR